jgi:hypothetical protein
MIDYIKSESKKMIFGCCKRYSIKNGMQVEDVQLILGLNTEENTYRMCQYYAPKEYYDIMQVLGVKIDFLGYSKIAPDFIQKALIRFSGKYGISIERVKVMCIPRLIKMVKRDGGWFTATEEEYDKEVRNKKLAEDVVLFLYDGENYFPTTYDVEVKDKYGNETIEEMVGLSFDDLFSQSPISKDDGLEP